MSIDLGFAPCRIADMQVGIVDVPGHENFVKTMVAGASGMDGVILVVAADDGVMPQTREHLDILTLLGIRHGLVALTKVDRVDADQREQARADLAAYLRGTFLEGAPVLPLSNVTGEGFDAFFEALLALVRSIPPRRADGVFRLPSDRAFSARDLGRRGRHPHLPGSASLGDEVVLLPQNAVSRIRRIEVYGQTGETVLGRPVRRASIWAIATHAEIARGDVLAAARLLFARGVVRLPRCGCCPTRKLHAEKRRRGQVPHRHLGSQRRGLLAQRRSHGGRRRVPGAASRTPAPMVAGPGDRSSCASLSPVPNHRRRHDSSRHSRPPETQSTPTCTPTSNSAPRRRRRPPLCRVLRPQGRIADCRSRRVSPGAPRFRRIALAAILGELAGEGGSWP